MDQLIDLTVVAGCSTSADVTASYSIRCAASLANTGSPITSIGSCTSSTHILTIPGCSTRCRTTATLAYATVTASVGKCSPTHVTCRKYTLCYGCCCYSYA